MRLSVTLTTQLEHRHRAFESRVPAMMVSSFDEYQFLEDFGFISCISSA